MENENIFTESQEAQVKALLQELTNEFSELPKYIAEAAPFFDENPPLAFLELHALDNLTLDAFAAGDDELIRKILNIIEVFLRNSDELLEELIKYFYFESFINALSWKGEEYVKKLEGMLGERSYKIHEELNKLYKVR
jgi:hypothetical protein